MALYSTGTKLGLKDAHKYAWLACPQCGKERWVRWADRTRWKGKSPLCNLCRAHNLNYKGGRRKTQGYVDVLLRPDDFFYPMTRKAGSTKQGAYVFEHRLIMAKHLGRCLHNWEIVHHKNHIRDDNRIENLQLVSEDRHTQITLLENRIGQLEKRVILLEAENIVLKEVHHSSLL